jgi:hypothetical protein
MVKRSLRCFPNLMCGPAWHRPMSGRRGGGSTRKSIGARAQDQILDVSMCFVSGFRRVRFPESPGAILPRPWLLCRKSACRVAQSQQILLHREIDRLKTAAVLMRGELTSKQGHVGRLEILLRERLQRIDELNGKFDQLRDQNKSYPPRTGT